MIRLLSELKSLEKEQHFLFPEDDTTTYSVKKVL